jgi:hypothetical protein
MFPLLAPSRPPKVRGYADGGFWHRPSEERFLHCTAPVLLAPKLTLVDALEQGKPLRHYRARERVVNLCFVYALVRRPRLWWLIPRAYEDCVTSN